MAVNSGFGSAFMGFGKGYLGALQQGERQKQSYLNTKLKQDDLTFRKNQALSDSAFRQWQITNAAEDRADARKNAASAAADRRLGLRNQAGIAASSALNDDLKMISSLSGPDQMRAWNTAVARQQSILGDFLDPEEFTKHINNVLPQPGAAIPGMTQPGLVAGGVGGDPRLMSGQAFEKNAGPLLPGQPRTFQDKETGAFTQVGRSAFDPRADAARQIMSAGIGGFNPANMARLGGAISNMYQPAAQGFDKSKDFTYEMPLKAEVGQVPMTATYKLGALDQANVDSKQQAAELSKIKANIARTTAPETIKQAQLKTEKLVQGITDSKFNREYKSQVFGLQKSKYELTKALGEANLQMKAIGLSQGDRRIANAELMTQLNAVYTPQRMMVGTGQTLSRMADTLSKLPTGSPDRASIQRTMAALSRDYNRFMVLSQMTSDTSGTLLDGFMAHKASGLDDDAALDKLIGFDAGDTVATAPFIPFANPEYKKITNNIEKNQAFPGSNPNARAGAAAGERARSGNPLGLPGGNHRGPGARPQVRQYG